MSWENLIKDQSIFSLVIILLILITLSLNPLNPKIKIWILICCPYSFPTEVVGRSW